MIWHQIVIQNIKKDMLLGYKNLLNSNENTKKFHNSFHTTIYMNFDKTPKLLLASWPV